MSDPFEYGRIHNLPPGVHLNDLDPLDAEKCPDCEEFLEDCDCEDLDARRP